MFYDFLKEYVVDLIECSDEEYNFTKKLDYVIEDVANDVSNNEFVWNVIDEAIYNSLDRYTKEEE